MIYSGEDSTHSAHFVYKDNKGSLGINSVDDIITYDTNEVNIKGKLLVNGKEVLLTSEEVTEETTLRELVVPKIYTTNVIKTELKTVNILHDDSLIPYINELFTNFTISVTSDIIEDQYNTKIMNIIIDDTYRSVNQFNCNYYYEIKDHYGLGIIINEELKQMMFIITTTTLDKTHKDYINHDLTVNYVKVNSNNRDSYVKQSELMNNNTQQIKFIDIPFVIVDKTLCYINCVMMNDIAVRLTINDVPIEFNKHIWQLVEFNEVFTNKAEFSNHDYFTEQSYTYTTDGKTIRLDIGNGKTYISIHNSTNLSALTYAEFNLEYIKTYTITNNNMIRENDLLFEINKLQKQIDELNRLKEIM